MRPVVLPLHTNNRIHRPEGVELGSSTPITGLPAHRAEDNMKVLMALSIRDTQTWRELGIKLSKFSSQE
jgi:hypothetical protein